jgi:hypothetical protein
MEVLLGTNPNSPDSDNDTVRDGVEVRSYNSNPLAMDSDGDGCNDAKEIASVNTDRTVSSGDLGLVAQHFSPPGGPLYVYGLDVNRDGAISSGDLGFIAKQFFAC